jgi:POT family proton-dependent oligopeptide transporter
VIFFIFATIFWGAYEQAGSTLNLFADRYYPFVDCRLSFPVLLVPIRPTDLRHPAGAGIRLALAAARRSRAVEPGKTRSRPLLRVAVIPRLVPAGAAAQASAGVRVSPWWLIVAYFITELGELCVSPVGLSLVTKLPPSASSG